MDLDGDKIDDLVSGSYTGGVSFFKGLGGGKFATESKLLPKNEKYEMHELALSPCGGDWDGDGDADLAVGQIRGPVRIMRNDGAGKFERAGNFKSEGKEIEAGDGGPCLTDWNADGKLDLLLGDEAGNVILYPGTEKGSLELGKAEYVLPRQTTEQGWREVKRDPASPTGLSARRPGARVKPFAADWNGDGKLDLLVGDFVQITRPPKILTREQKTRLARLKSEQQAQMKRMSSASMGVQQEALKDIGEKSANNLSPEKMKAFQEAWRRRWEARAKAMAPDQKRQMELYKAIEELEPRPEAAGFVWVYLRK